MEKINLKVVEATVKDVCTKYFDIDFESLGIPVKINGRLTKCLGRVIYRHKAYKVIPKSIEFSKELVSGNYKVETVESVIKHEVTHLALMLKGMEFHDGSTTFEETVKKIGGTSTRTIKSLVKYHAKCSCCGQRCLTTTSKQQYKRYLDNMWKVSKCCSSVLVPDGETIVPDETKFENEDAGELLKNNIERQQNKKVKKVNKSNVKPINKTNNDDVMVDPETHLIASKNGQVKVNQTSLWRSLTYYVDKKNDNEIKFLYENFKNDFIKGYKCLTKNRMKYIDYILKVEV